MTRPSRPARRPARKPLALADRFVLTEVASHLLRRAHFRAESLFAETLGRFGLTPRQKALLVTAYQHPGETQSQFAERIALDRNSFAEMLPRMIRRGLVRRVRADADRRAYAIYLTDKGRRLLEEILPLDAEVERKVLEPLPAEYRPLFLKCLKMLVGLTAP